MASTWWRTPAPALMPGTWGGMLALDLTSANHHSKHSTDVKIVHKGTVVEFKFMNIRNAKI
jgi:hypothetical protein